MVIGNCFNIVEKTLFKKNIKSQSTRRPQYIVNKVSKLQQNFRHKNKFQAKSKQKLEAIKIRNKFPLKTFNIITTCK